MDLSSNCEAVQVGSCQLGSLFFLSLFFFSLTRIVVLNFGVVASYF